MEFYILQCIHILKPGDHPFYGDIDRIYMLDFKYQDKKTKQKTIKHRMFQCNNYTTYKDT